ncbi:hypothetical protein [Exiguobacterium antarcticum]|uniref:hypothetical protein n=1 Tax=Exiguobacterium antarcticum TaxID=132920 RepID=UPI000285EEAF|nr:hypothetical protein [Exiguobacterium antarcticum]AFS70530.1 Hypothetical protein Eab7_1410 [Exiguobacterium antarcticum B7]
MLKPILVCSLSALLLAGCSTEEAVSKKVVKPTELPLTLKLDESKKPANSLKNEVIYAMTGQTDKPLYLTGTEYLASGKQKIWFSETIQPGTYDGKELKLGQQFDSTKGYRSYTYELDGTMHDWSEESNAFKGVMISDVEFRDKSFRPSAYELLMFEKSTVQETMKEKSMDTIHSPKDIRLNKGESAFTITLSVKKVDDTL